LLMISRSTIEGGEQASGPSNIRAFAQRAFIHRHAYCRLLGDFVVGCAPQ
jgi:hypothetical protein